jgi:para-nitrobenzyl esterase
MPIMTTSTAYGKVRGRLAGNHRIAVFKGIPYAAPPVGNRRFMPPVAPEPWEGVRDCIEFASIAWQDNPPAGTPFGDFFIKEFYPVQQPMSEDCLYLNIWTPANSVDEKLPVMMWIHGGGLSAGYSYEMEFDGEAIAKRGAVLVTVGYRLGSIGFFAHPEISRKNPQGVSGNNTLLDHVQAMKWLRENIASFGGDPDNILIFGQSGGAGAVMAHLASPISRQFFDKAIIMSSPSGLDTRPRTFQNSLAEVEEWGVKTCAALNKSLDELYEMSGEELFKALSQAAKDLGGRANMAVDGWFLNESSALACKNGRTADIPVMGGMVDGDGSMVFPGTKQDAKSWQEAAANARLGKYADKLFDQYPIDDPQNTPIYEALRDSGPYFSTLTFGEALNKAGHQPGFLYYMNPEIPGKNLPGFIPDGQAYHSADLMYVFGTLDRIWRRFDGRHYDLMNQVIDYWTNFARTGDPNGEGLTRWPAYCQDETKIMYMTENEMEPRDYMEGSMKKVFRAILGQDN